MKRHPLKFISRCIPRFIIFALIFSLIFPPSIYAQTVTLTNLSANLNLPAPGNMLPMSTAHTPVIARGLTIYPEDPLQFDLLIDTGDSNLKGEALELESEKLIKYFLAALTVPEDQMWVNLSPYEKDRIIPGGFGQTEMGRDLLAQDYILKQLTASVMYPEDDLGKEFWNRVYAKAAEKYGTTNIPVNTFNKVWIVPEDATVYEQGKSVFVVKNRLKVMLEEDYLAMENRLDGSKSQDAGGKDENIASEFLPLASKIINEVLIPEIEKEVNEGQNFAQLRQVYHSMILATWYKLNLKESLLGQVYVDQEKTKGIHNHDEQVNQKIYQQYLKAFEKGVYDYIREDYDPSMHQVIPRRYFSGGLGFEKLPNQLGANTWKGLEAVPIAERPYVRQMLSLTKKRVHFTLHEAKRVVQDVADQIQLFWQNSIHSKWNFEGSQLAFAGRDHFMSPPEESFENAWEDPKAQKLVGGFLKNYYPHWFREDLASLLKRSEKFFIAYRDTKKYSGRELRFAFLMQYYRTRLGTAWTKRAVSMGIDGDTGANFRAAAIEGLYALGEFAPFLKAELAATLLRHLFIELNENNLLRIREIVKAWDVPAKSIQRFLIAIILLEAPLKAAQGLDDEGHRTAIIKADIQRKVFAQRFLQEIAAHNDMDVILALLKSRRRIGEYLFDYSQFLDLIDDTVESIANVPRSTRENPYLSSQPLFFENFDVYRVYEIFAGYVNVNDTIESIEFARPLDMNRREVVVRLMARYLNRTYSGPFMFPLYAVMQASKYLEEYGNFQIRTFTGINSTPDIEWIRQYHVTPLENHAIGKTKNKKLPADADLAPYRQVRNFTEVRLAIDVLSAYHQALQDTTNPQGKEVELQSTLRMIDSVQNSIVVNNPGDHAYLGIQLNGDTVLTRTLETGEYFVHPHYQVEILSGGSIRVTTPQDEVLEFIKKEDRYALKVRNLVTTQFKQENEDAQQSEDNVPETELPKPYLVGEFSRQYLDLVTRIMANELGYDPNALSYPGKSFPEAAVLQAARYFKEYGNFNVRIHREENWAPGSAEIIITPPGAGLKVSKTGVEGAKRVLDSDLAPYRRVQNYENAEYAISALTRYHYGRQNITKPRLKEKSFLSNLEVVTDGSKGIYIADTSAHNYIGIRFNNEIILSRRLTTNEFYVHPDYRVEILRGGSIRITTPQANVFEIAKQGNQYRFNFIDDFMGDTKDADERELPITSTAQIAVKDVLIHSERGLINVKEIIDNKKFKATYYHTSREFEINLDETNEGDLYFWQNNENKLHESSYTLAARRAAYRNNPMLVATLFGFYAMKDGLGLVERNYYQGGTAVKNGLFQEIIDEVYNFEGLPSGEYQKTGVQIYYIMSSLSKGYGYFDGIERGSGIDSEKQRKIRDALKEVFLRIYEQEGIDLIKKGVEEYVQKYPSTKFYDKGWPFLGRTGNKLMWKNLEEDTWLYFRTTLQKRGIRALFTDDELSQYQDRLASGDQKAGDVGEDFMAVDMKNFVPILKGSFDQAVQVFAGYLEQHVKASGQTFDSLNIGAEKIRSFLTSFTNEPFAPTAEAYLSKDFYLKAKALNSDGLYVIDFEYDLNIVGGGTGTVRLSFVPHQNVHGITKNTIYTVTARDPSMDNFSSIKDGFMLMDHITPLLEENSEKIVTALMQGMGKRDYPFWLKGIVRSEIEELLEALIKARTFSVETSVKNIPLEMNISRSIVSQDEVRYFIDFLYPSKDDYSQAVRIELKPTNPKNVQDLTGKVRVVNPDNFMAGEKAVVFQNEHLEMAKADTELRAAMAIYYIYLEYDDKLRFEDEIDRALEWGDIFNNALLRERLTLSFGRVMEGSRKPFIEHYLDQDPDAGAVMLEYMNLPEKWRTHVDVLWEDTQTRSSEQLREVINFVRKLGQEVLETNIEVLQEAVKVGVFNNFMMEFKYLANYKFIFVDLKPKAIVLQTSHEAIKQTYKGLSEKTEENNIVAIIDADNDGQLISETGFSDLLQNERFEDHSLAYFIFWDGDQGKKNVAVIYFEDTASWPDGFMSKFNQYVSIVASDKNLARAKNDIDLLLRMAVFTIFLTGGQKVAVEELLTSEDFSAKELEGGIDAIMGEDFVVNTISREGANHIAGSMMSYVLLSSSVRQHHDGIYFLADGDRSLKIFNSWVDILVAVEDSLPSSPQVYSDVSDSFSLNEQTQKILQIVQQGRFKPKEEGVDTQLLYDLLLIGAQSTNVQLGKESILSAITDYLAQGYEVNAIIDGKHYDTEIPNPSFSALEVRLQEKSFVYFLDMGGKKLNIIFFDNVADKFMSNNQVLKGVQETDNPLATKAADVLPDGALVFADDRAEPWFKRQVLVNVQSESFDAQSIRDQLPQGKRPPVSTYMGKDSVGIADFFETLANSLDGSWMNFEVILAGIVEDDLGEEGLAGTVEKLLEEASHEKLDLNAKTRKWLAPLIGKLKPEHFNRFAELLEFNEQFIHRAKVVRNQLGLKEDKPLIIDITTGLLANFVEAFLNKVLPEGLTLRKKLEDNGIQIGEIISVRAKFKTGMDGFMDVKTDAATDFIPHSEMPVGGIDLNPARLNLNIKRGNRGLPLPMNQQSIDDLMNIEGFFPIIINITPLNNIPFRLGFLVDEPEQGDRDFSYYPDPKAIESKPHNFSQRPEQVSFLD